jgi:phosphotransferase system  glucose/maltose/N-acetylglucosamine-specific IIC component
VIAVLLVVILMCWIEKRLRAVLPGSIELILNPLLTTLITGSVAIVALQPLGGGSLKPSPTVRLWLLTAAACWWARCCQVPSCRWC